MRTGLSIISLLEQCIGQGTRGRGGRAGWSARSCPWRHLVSAEPSGRLVSATLADVPPRFGLPMYSRLPEDSEAAYSEK